MDDERTAGLVKPTNIYKIEGPGVTAGVEIQDGKVLDATDNFHWIKDWPFEKVKEFCGKRGWSLSLAGMDWR